MKKITVVLVAFVVVTLLSGCYALREFDWSKDKVKPGDKAKADLGFIGLEGPAIPPFRFFLIVPEGTELDYRKLKFDTKGALGKPQQLVRDNSLGAITEDLPSCDPDAPDIRRRGTEEDSLLFRTKTNIPVTSNLVHGSIVVKASESDAAGNIGGSFITGLWADDGDGVPEDPDSTDDGVGCFGIATSFLIKKGGT